MKSKEFEQSYSEKK